MTLIQMQIAIDPFKKLTAEEDTIKMLDTISDEAYYTFSKFGSVEEVEAFTKEKLDD